MKNSLFFAIGVFLAFCMFWPSVGHAARYTVASAPGCWRDSAGARGAIPPNYPIVYNNVANRYEFYNVANGIYREVTSFFPDPNGTSQSYCEGLYSSTPSLVGQIYYSVTWSDSWLTDYGIPAPTDGNGCSSPSNCITCSSFTYSDWSSCSNNTQTRNVLTSSPAACTGGSPVTSQSCQSNPASCSDGQKSGNEVGIDCGGDCIGVSCEGYCPDGYDYMPSLGGCYTYADKDASGNCPNLTGQFGSVVYTETAENQCIYRTDVLLAKDGLEDLPVSQYPAQWVAGAGSTVKSSTVPVVVDNGDGTSTRTWTETETTTLADGSVITTSRTFSETFSNSTGEVLSNSSSENSTLPAEANWDNYDVSNVAPDDTGLTDFTVWGERPDWSSQERDLTSIRDAIENSELQLFSPTPVLIAGSYEVAGSTVPIYFSLAEYENHFRVAGALLLTITYVGCLISFSRRD